MKLMIALIMIMSILTGCSKPSAIITATAAERFLTEEVKESAKWEIMELNRKKYLNELKEVNDDFVGILRVSSIIEELVVHSSDNNEYLRLNFEKEYHRYGTIFMDYRNTLDDQNIIMYGHYVYYDEDGMFTELHLLKDQDNYEEHKYIELETIEGIRQYQVAAVFYYDLNADYPQYYQTSYSDIDGYLEDIAMTQFYDTGIEITNKSKLLTLQTCVRNRDDLRLIVVAVQTN